jgi:p-hydroxybenzoate 3-monooxygenase
MTTQVAIIGGGPAGMLLSELLHRQGVASVVLERQSRAYVVSRIRAGVLEPTTVEVLRANGLAARMDREGHVHDGMKIVWAGRESYLIDIHKHVGKRFVAYGQTNLQEDLYEAADSRGAQLAFEAAEVQPRDFQTDRPWVSFGKNRRLDCDRAAPRVELGAHLLVPHQPAAPFPRRERLRSARAGVRARVRSLFGPRPGRARRAVRGSAAIMRT